MCRKDVAVEHEMIKEIRAQRMLDRMHKIHKENFIIKKEKIFSIKSTSGHTQMRLTDARLRRVTRRMDYINRRDRQRCETWIWYDKMKEMERFHYLGESVTLKRKCDRNMKEQRANRLSHVNHTLWQWTLKPFTHRWTRNSKQQRCRSTYECWEYCEVNMWTVRKFNEQWELKRHLYRKSERDTEILGHIMRKVGLKNVKLAGYI